MDGVERQAIDRRIAKLADNLWVDLCENVGDLNSDRWTKRIKSDIDGLLGSLAAKEKAASKSAKAARAEIRRLDRIVSDVLRDRDEWWVSEADTGLASSNANGQETWEMTT